MHQLSNIVDDKKYENTYKIGAHTEIYQHLSLTYRHPFHRRQWPCHLREITVHKQYL